MDNIPRVELIGTPSALVMVSITRLLVIALLVSSHNIQIDTNVVVDLSYLHVKLTCKL